MKSLLVVFVFFALLTAYFREPLVRMVRTNQLHYELIESEQDLEDAMGKRNAFVFVKADWSIDSVIAQREIDEFAIDWIWSGRKPSVNFYLIDITESGQQQDMVIRWAKSDRKLGFIHGGYGSAIWLRGGEVLERIDGSLCTRIDLSEHTKELFGD